MSLAECFERNKITHFLFVSLLQIQFLSVFRQPNAWRCSSAHVNDLELKTCENKIYIYIYYILYIYIYIVMFSFQIFWAKHFRSNFPLHTVDLNQTRWIFSSSSFFVHLFWKIVLWPYWPKNKIGKKFRKKLEAVKI